MLVLKGELEFVDKSSNDVPSRGNICAWTSAKACLSWEVEGFTMTGLGCVGLTEESERVMMIGGYEMQKFYLNFLFRPCKTANWSSFLNKYFKKNLHCAAGVWFLSQEQNHQNPQEKLGSVVFLTRPCYSHHKVCEEPGTSHRVPLWGANCMRNISRHSWYLATWGTTHTEGKQVFHSKDHLSGYIFYCG